MSLNLVVGGPGAGKGVYLARLADRALKSHRRVYADYGLVGARPWLEWSDVASRNPDFQGALYLADELGSTFGARNTLDLDKLVFWATTMHRHAHNDIWGAAQHLAYVDVQFRRLIDSVVVVKRYGVDGRAALLGKPPHLWRRPVAFRAQYFKLADFNAAGDLLPLAVPFWTEWYPWRKRWVFMYDSAALFVPSDLAARYESLLASSAVRSALPPMGFVKHTDIAWQQVQVASRVSGRRQTDVEEDAESRARARGFYLPSLDQEPEFPF